MRLKQIKETIQVVCGAPNARTGMKGIFAPEGSFIPGTGITLKKTSIRGVQSARYASIREEKWEFQMNMSSIIDVGKSFKIGESFAKIFGLNDSSYRNWNHTKSW